MRFSIRDLLWLMTLVCVVLGQEHRIRELSKSRLYQGYTWAAAGGWMKEFADSHGWSDLEMAGAECYLDEIDPGRAWYKRVARRVLQQDAKSNSRRSGTSQTSAQLEWQAAWDYATVRSAAR